MTLRDLWAQVLTSGTMDAWGAVLLSPLSSVKALHIEDGFLTGGLLIGIVLREALLSDSDRHVPPDPSRPEEVSHVREIGSRQDAVDLTSLFYLPRIREFSATILRPTAFSWSAQYPRAPSC
jgi:hypothetical protein